MARVGGVSAGVSALVFTRGARSGAVRGPPAGPRGVWSAGQFQRPAYRRQHRRQPRPCSSAWGAWQEAGQLARAGMQAGVGASRVRSNGQAPGAMLLCCVRRWWGGWGGRAMPGKPRRLEGGHGRWLGLSPVGATEGSGLRQHAAVLVGRGTIWKEVSERNIRGPPSGARRPPVGLGIRRTRQRDEVFRAGRASLRDIGG